MKNFYLIAILLTSVTVFSQNAPIDFESDGYGANWTWTVFENDDNPPLEIVANPDMSGINTSTTVAKFTARQTGQPWAGCESLHGSDIGTFSINSNNSIIKIMVWKSVISDVGIKLTKPDGWSMGELKVANTVINAWEEITIDFSSQVQDGYDQIVVFPDFDLDGRTQDNVIYFDNITFSNQGGVVTEPETAAPTPTQDAQDVISMFSDMYSDISVDTWLTPWSAAVLEDIEIQNNPTKKYTFLDYAGIETVTNSIDLESTGMSYLHIDFWTPNSTAFRIKLVDFGGDGFGGGNDSEAELEFTPVISEWNSLNIPLEEFAGMNMSDISQFVISSNPSGQSTIFIDNVFYYKDFVGVNNGSAINVSIYPNPTHDLLYINTETFMDEVQVFDLSGRLVISKQPKQSGIIQLDASNLESGFYLIRINGNQHQEFKLIKE